MRHVGLLVGFNALALVVVACGPDPNARLPGSANPENTGGITSVGGSGEGGGSGTTTVGHGGSSGNGGTTVVSPGSGGAAGSSPFDTGGSGGTKPASGGAAGSSPFGNGGAAAGGTTSKGGSGAGGSGAGGTTLAQGGAAGVGTGGSTVPSQGGSSGSTVAPGTGFTFPTGTEPCTPTMKDVSGGHSDQLGAGAACFRTADEISDWSCSGAEDRTVKVNGTEVTKCGTTVKRAGSFFYFEFGAGANAWATVSWWCSNCGGTGAHAVPTCGHYPAWESGATVAACADGATTATAPTTTDGGVGSEGIDSGS
jgi:hypothetical protein